MTCAFSDDPDNEDCQTVGDRMAAEWPPDEFHITLGHLHDECDDQWCDHDNEDTAGEPEPWFSKSECEGCGSPLDGDREYATAWKKA